MDSSADAAPDDPTPEEDRQTVERLVPLWLDEAARHDPAAAADARRQWERRSLSAEAARELADWATARVTDTAFNEDEGPWREGPARIGVSDKAAVHRWLAARGRDV
ncbi:hypothetical protein [Streptomyces lichenis]|uniref:Uncharacterized protein n=1 Tax=Streptomyces lichenis TaxID=2306967 RepID=A0ABT0I8V1_9ACTN|nr:hypothetical protein [Streptomyces lichenis]MCK8677742.1 hypothetical protein [Streptomyces lichenis]